MCSELRREGAMDSSTQRGTEKASWSRHATCMNTFEKGVERRVGVQQVAKRAGVHVGKHSKQKEQHDLG